MRSSLIKKGEGHHHHHHVLKNKSHNTGNGNVQKHKSAYIEAHFQLHVSTCTSTSTRMIVVQMSIIRTCIQPVTLQRNSYHFYMSHFLLGHLLAPCYLVHLMLDMIRIYVPAI